MNRSVRIGSLQIALALIMNRDKYEDTYYYNG